ncbi:WYL domain-containing protein [Streptomyces sp. NPDC088846]|uniref:WYL domain-containing protein n=1 Tax=unclassified Streptomyces TaxID=2593676 RepID=UPI003805E88B
MTPTRTCHKEVEAGLDHSSGNEVRRRRRQIEPYRLVASDRRWYLLAWVLGHDG